MKGATACAVGAENKKRLPSNATSRPRIYGGRFSCGVWKRILGTPARNEGLVAISTVQLFTIPAPPRLAPSLVETNHLPPAPEVATVESGENVRRCRPNSNSARNLRDIHSQKCRDGTEIVFLGIQQSMPYASGETPEMGDQISDKRGRVGAVTRITINLRKVSELTIRWNDGIVGILYPVAEEFTLISRAVKSDEQ